MARYVQLRATQRWTPLYTHSCFHVYALCTYFSLENKCLYESLVNGYISVYIFDSSVYADNEAPCSLCKTLRINWRVTV